jgi:tetratricopeptide (TPR) repeat protein
MTTQLPNSRRQKLEEFVAANPNDPFGRYGLALELARNGEYEAAIEQFQKLIEGNPSYVAGFQQLGQLLARIGRTEEARHAFQAGIAAAEKSGNEHARSEMEGMLGEVK